MKNTSDRKKNKQSGVTLISLVVTIIILLILATVAGSAGISAINSAKLTSFTTQMKLMQIQVNELYHQAKNKGTVTMQDGTEFTGEEIIKGKESGETIGKPLSEANQAQVDKVFRTAEENGSDIVDMTGYRYFNQDTIKALKIEEVNQEFLINIEKRSVISYLGLKYLEHMYYTLDQLPDDLYNVDYAPNTGTPVIKETTVEQISNDKWRITILDVEYSGYIDKWQVKYQLVGDNNWYTSDKLDFVVNQEGEYHIKVQHDNLESLEKIVYTDDWIPLNQEELNDIELKKKAWYHYENATVNEPNLKGKMTPIKYVG